MAAAVPEAGDPTGGYLLLLAPEEEGLATDALRAAAGTGPAQHTQTEDSAAVAEALAAGAPVVFDEIGVVVVRADADHRQALLRAAAEMPSVLAVEPERTLYAIAEMPSADYLRGYRDGVDSAVAAALGELAGRSPAASHARPGLPGLPGLGGARAGPHAVDEASVTWGLQAVRVPESAWTGAGVRLCVLDTGVAHGHPDFAERDMVTRSFVAGEVEDGHGHGTHCLGTACGPVEPSALPRYGVAGAAEPYVGKVLSDAGSGDDRGILAGIDWAIRYRARVVSMSLGAPTQVGQPYSQVYESVARRAMARGTLIVAAAGNDSARPEKVAPVSHPANCPSILAVAAVDAAGQVAAFSAAGLDTDGGQVDIAAPGVDVHSAWPGAPAYRRLSGTSMATPHVAGVVALLAEASPEESAAELKDRLATSALRLPLPCIDVGAGLVQAP